MELGPQDPGYLDFKGFKVFKGVPAKERWRGPKETILLAYWEPRKVT